MDSSAVCPAGHVPEGLQLRGPSPARSLCLGVRGSSSAFQGKRPGTLCHGVRRVERCPVTCRAAVKKMWHSVHVSARFTAFEAHAAVAASPDELQAQTQRLRVDIETVSPLSSGQTVCDVWGQSGKSPNCTVAASVDVDAFWDLMLHAVTAADTCTPMNGLK
jgi:hypothetical protein